MNAQQSTLKKLDFGRIPTIFNSAKPPNPHNNLPRMAEARMQQRGFSVLTLEESHLNACGTGDLERLEYLLNTYGHHASLKKRCLEKAAAKSQLNVMRYLLESNPAIEIDSWTAWSAAWGGLDAYKLLHSKHPDIPQWYFGHHGNAVHVATKWRDSALLEYLLEHGLDPGRNLAEDSDCRAGPLTPMDNAALTSVEPDIAKILVKYGALVNGTGALEISAQLGRLSMARYFLDVGADINQVRPRDSNWSFAAPLAYAVRSKRVEMVQFLLQNGADPSVRDNDGKSVLDDARATGHEEIIRLIEENNST